MRKQAFIDRFFKLFLLFIMILALSMGIRDYFSMDISFIDLLLYDLILVLATSLLYSFPQIIGWGILASAAAAVYMKYYHGQLFDKMLREALLFLQWLPAYIAGYAVYLEEYSIQLLITILFFSAGLMSVLVFSKINKLVVTAIGIIVFSFFWFTYVEKAKLYLMIYFFSSLILHSYSLWEKKKGEWSSREIPISLSFYSSWIISALLLIGFSIFFMLMLPLNIRPLRVTAINNFMMRNFPFVEQWKNSSEESYGYSFRFSLSTAVYNGKKLGGPISFSGIRMLTLKSDLKSNLYLRGSVYDKYTGFNWNKSRKVSQPYERDKPDDLPPKLKYREVKMEIKPERLVSSTFFSALYPAGIGYDGDKIFINQDFELYGGNLISSGTSYEIKSKVPLLSERMLRTQFSYADEDMMKQYLKLPQGIPGRVKKLVEELTWDKSSNYDKAKAIADYLRKNHIYTLKPGKVPEDKDFIDYFLFEKKEGYCTYFATSMAVMLRLAGIPSRYVEGFLIKPEGQGKKTYDVLDSEAHAWVEANLGEYGWVTFEPTPAYEDVKPEELPEDGGTGEAPQSNGNDLPSFSQDAVNKSRREKELMEEDIYTGEDSKIKGDDKSTFITIFIFIISAFVLSRIFYGIIRINIFKFMKLKNSKKFAESYIKQVIWMLERANRKKYDSETFREFINSASGAFELDKDSCEYIISTIEGIIYGEKTIEYAEAYELKSFGERLRKNIKAKLGIMEYILNFYFGKP